MEFNTVNIVNAYAQGYFPMADSRESEEIYWHCPDPRAIIPFNDIKMLKSVRQLFKKDLYTFTINKCFRDVVIKCSERDETWINDSIIDEYEKLQCLGFAQSIEAWREGKMVGGLYGVTIGAAFFGESMFSTETNVSKLCYYVLISILKNNNFLLLDSQYINEHTQMLGAIEISKNEYYQLLNKALSKHCHFILN